MLNEEDSIASSPKLFMWQEKIVLCMSFQDIETQAYLLRNLLDSLICDCFW